MMKQEIKDQVACGMHIVHGFTEQRSESSVASEVVSNSGMGDLEFFEQLAEYAPLCQRLFDEGYEEFGGVVGVYHYEVSWELGAWIAHQMMTKKTIPSDMDVEAETIRLSEGFWSQFKDK